MSNWATSGICRLLFRIAFLMGGPYFWDETTQHAEPKCFMELVVQEEEEEEIMPWLQGIPWVMEEPTNHGM